MNTQIQSFCWIQRLVAIALSVALAGAPSLAAQDSAPVSPAEGQVTAPVQPETAQPAPQAPAPAYDPRFGDNTTVMPDPSRGPQQPVQPLQAPATATPQDQNPPAPPQAQAAPAPQTRQPQEYQEPSGTAAAQRGTTQGGAASRPAGEAIAPAKQRQVRSLLIKVGVIVAGAAALGAVYGLSKSTSSVPPGARPAAASSTSH